MKIIGAGFGRTGTMSLQAALERLGYPCYHMKEVIKNADHLRRWHAFTTADARMDWRALFADYEATVDFPACLYYRELMEAFPQALVILSVRDPDPWYASWSWLRESADQMRRFSFIPRVRKMLEFGDSLIMDGTFGGHTDRDSNVEVFERHNAEVQASVPAERLLVYEIQQGWGPLCEFLGCEVPDEPFPHLNAGRDTVDGLLRRFVADNAIRLMGFGAVILAVVVLVLLLAR